MAYPSTARLAGALPKRRVFRDTVKLSDLEHIRLQAFRDMATQPRVRPPVDQRRRRVHPAMAEPAPPRRRDPVRPASLGTVTEERRRLPPAVSQPPPSTSERVAQLPRQRPTHLQARPQRVQLVTALLVLEVRVDQADTHLAAPVPLASHPRKRASPECATGTRRLNS